MVIPLLIDHLAAGHSSDHCEVFIQENIVLHFLTMTNNLGSYYIYRSMVYVMRSAQIFHVLLIEICKLFCTTSLHK